MVLPLLRETKYQTHPCAEDLIQHIAEIFDAFLDHPFIPDNAYYMIYKGWILPKPFEASAFLSECLDIGDHHPVLKFSNSLL